MWFENKSSKGVETTYVPLQFRTKTLNDLAYEHIEVDDAISAQNIRDNIRCQEIGNQYIDTLSGEL